MSVRDVIADTLRETAWDDDGADRRAENVLVDLGAAGYMVVPIKPTLAMVRAAAQLDFSAQHDPSWPEFYHAMIAAFEKEMQK